MLPEWMTAIEGEPGTFLIDPDIFYPAFLAEMGVGEDEVDRYQLEIAYGCMKRDANRAARTAGLLKGLKGMTMHVRGDDGRKLRWHHTMHKPGKLDITADGNTRERNRAVRAMYRRLRGS